MLRPVLSLALCPVLLACGGSPSMSDWDTPTGEATLAVEDVSPAEGVTALEPVCLEGADEVCNGADADCDGHIDEGCEGVEPGALEVSVAWNAGADLDLVVDDAGDVDRVEGRGACEEGGGTVEHVRASALAPGEVRISLRHADACSSEDPVTASVFVTFEGRPVGVYNRAVAAGETSDVATIRLAASE